MIQNFPIKWQHVQLKGNQDNIFDAAFKLWQYTTGRLRWVASQPTSTVIKGTCSAANILKTYTNLFNVIFFFYLIWRWFSWQKWHQHLQYSHDMKECPAGGRRVKVRVAAAPPPCEQSLCKWFITRHRIRCRGCPPSVGTSARGTPWPCAPWTP